jgi:hypothetical protein
MHLLGDMEDPPVCVAFLQEQAGERSQIDGRQRPVDSELGVAGVADDPLEKGAGFALGRGEVRGPDVGDDEGVAVGARRISDSSRQTPGRR